MNVGPSWVPIRCTSRVEIYRGPPNFRIADHTLTSAHVVRELQALQHVGLKRRRNASVFCQPFDVVRSPICQSLNRASGLVAAAGYEAAAIHEKQI